MSDRGDRENQQADDIARIPALLKEWAGVVATFGGAVAAVFAVLLPEKKPAAVQVIGYAVALILLGVGCFVFIRVRRRQRSRQLREKRRETWEREEATAHRTAFRGLFPYQEGDELPGEHRQLEARRLVTLFSEPTFSFGVVCGDSGCGKTSLLRSAIQSRLKAAGEEKGFRLLYLSNPRELADDGAQYADTKEIATKLRRELERLRRLTEETGQGKPLILIIDQFEEFFIEYGSPELRLELGRFLNGLIRSNPPVRILCAIRRDYLADMKELAPQAPDAAERNFFEPISLQTLFTLKNFTVEQATRVVKECAERDRVEVEDEFAETLASDLGEGGFVRPPELQIVCTALVSNMTTAEYRLAGGARGILSHYIEDAIDVSGDPAVGRRVMRALCDFPAHAKRNPQTVAEIAEAVGAEGAQESVSVRTALRQFEVARLVSSEKRGADEPAYALVHDYLVDAVSKATSDVSTRDEEANQLLDYYVSEYRSDPKTRIPYRRLRFVRQYADPKKLADATVQRLLRASAMRLAITTAALAALVLITTTLLVAITTTRRVWHQEVIGRHSGLVRLKEAVGRAVEPNRGRLLAGVTFREQGRDNLELWDVKTASRTYSFKREWFRYIAPEYILGYSRNEPVVTALHLPTARESQTVIPTNLFEDMVFPPDEKVVSSASGRAIAIRKRNFVRSEELEQRPQPPPPVSVFSIADNKMIGEMPTCYSPRIPDPYITDDGEYFIDVCYEGKAVTPMAFNMRTKEKRALLRPGFTGTDVIDFDERNSRVASLEVSRDRRVYLVLWDVRRGQVIDNRDVNLDSTGDVRDSFELAFTPDGEFLYNNNRQWGVEGHQYFTLFRVNGLRRETTVPDFLVKAILTPGYADNTGVRDHPMLLWPATSGGTYLWDLAEAEPKLLADLTISLDSRVFDVAAVTDTGIRGVLVVRGQIELWDFKAGKKLKTLDIPGRVVDVDFTIGGNAVSVSIEGGTVSLFRADDGEKITDEIRNIGGSSRAIYYDEKCRRAHVWTDEGRVLRYTYGWYLFGQESWFWPAEEGEA
jgi:WD40 repeat protein